MPHRYGRIAMVALQHLAGGNVSAAVDAYRRLRDAAPANDPTGSEEDLADWGFQLLGRLDFARAAPMFEMASTLYPSSVRIAFGLGESRMWAGQLNDAETAYRRSIASVRDDRVTSTDVKQMLAGEAASRLREIARRRGAARAH
jgi:Tfp pilus assembly protein PilF